MPSPTDEPLIYTNKGNLPIASLQYSTHWEDAPEYVKLVERYMLDGEVVRESAHILSKRGALSDVIAGRLNG